MHAPDPSRRALLRAAAAAALAPLSPSRPAAAQAATWTLRAAPARLSLLGVPHPDTDVWCYNGSVPGPTLRVRQGERLEIAVVNDLAQGTTVHWHGIRLPNAMDGVPDVTQQPIAAGGGRFAYAFTCPDAGTFWYHPHANGSEQVERGLHGALIVEEATPPDVDRDEVWVLDDWKMEADGQVADDFDSLFDASHAGRIGNTVTINGRLPDRFALVAGERIRLRLVNVANARIFSLAFEGHAPTVIAHDGMPCEPYAPKRIVLGPGMRADVVLDATAEPGAVFRVLDDFAPRGVYEVVKLAYADARRARLRARDARLVLPANPVAMPDVERAQRHRITFTGGMMGRMPGAMGGMGGMRGMGGMGGSAGGSGHVWAINGKSMDEAQHRGAPLLTLRRDRSYVLELVNDTAWWHPVHLHGHSFRIVSRNGSRLPQPVLVDTTLLPPRERADIAFVADNPGDWMFHCHVLEHQATGMMGTIRVA